MTKLLFFDAFHLQACSGLDFRAHPPVKAGAPVLVPEQPWESWRAFPIANCVMYENGRYRMWYETGYDEQTVPGQRLNRTAYAESADGQHWEKPPLGQYDYQGSRDNNIFDLGPFGVHNVSVVRDEQATDPDQRYKMSFFTMPPRNGPIPHGINVATSPDGLRWSLARPAQDPAYRAWRDVVPDRVRSGDTHSLVGWVPPVGQYVMLARTMDLVPYMFRTIGYSTSPNFVNWSAPVNVLSPDEHDPWGTEFYYITVQPYGEVYLGHLCVFHNYSRRLTAARPDHYAVPDELAYMNQRLDTCLVYSRDLQVWRYVEPNRSAFLPVGEKGAWDSGMIFGSSILDTGDEIRIYYGGTPMRHMVEDLEHAGTNDALRMFGGLAHLRPDGFASLQADATVGECITVPVVCAGAGLKLNAATAPDGFVTVQLLDADSDSPLSPEFRFTGDELAASLDLDTGRLQGQKVRLRITARQADIFSLTL